MNFRGLLLAGMAAALGTSLVAQQPDPPAAQTPSAQMQAQTPAGPAIRVHIYGGIKTHGEGQHDYPQFLADWSKILTQRGAYVTGGLQFPSARELSSADVLVIYKGDAGYLSMEDRAALDAFLRRGGGIISLHDALCGPEPEYFATIVGGAKKHGETNFTLEANVPYTIVATAHPIMQGMTDFAIKDEAFYRMTWSKAPEITVLATATMDNTPSAQSQKVVGDVVPQIWTYEKSLAPAPTGVPYRAFVWMQGHNYSNFAHPQVQPMLLRAIAWTAKRPVDALSTVRPARGGGRGTSAAGPAGRGGN